MSGRADPRPKRRKRRNRPRRVENPHAIVRKLLRDPECRVAGCGLPAGNGHHLVQRGSPHFGDDVEENIVPVCGTGTSGHHGALHGSPFTDSKGRRWTAEETAAGLGERLRRDEIRYVLLKLGLTAGVEYLIRSYGLDSKTVPKRKKPGLVELRSEWDEREAEGTLDQQADPDGKDDRTWRELLNAAMEKAAMESAS